MIAPKSVLGSLLVLGLACAGSRPPGLGVSSGELAACPSSPNCVSSRATTEQHAIEPMAIAAPDAPRAAIWRVVEESIAALPRVVIVERADGYLRAEQTSSLMGYVDDFELWLPAAASAIEVRSASRVGYGDMGVNRARVEALR